MRIGLLALALAGCAAGEKPVAEFGSGTCDAGGATMLVGRVADEKIVAGAKRLSRSKVVRVVSPGAMVTMDYRTDRLNLSVDAARRVVSVNCG